MAFLLSLLSVNSLQNFLSVSRFCRSEPDCAASLAIRKGHSMDILSINCIVGIVWFVYSFLASIPECESYEMYSN